MTPPHTPPATMNSPTIEVPSPATLKEANSCGGGGQTELPIFNIINATPTPSICRNEPAAVATDPQADLPSIVNNNVVLGQDNDKENQSFQ